MDAHNFIQHSGILGMKWGKKNGPPYPLSKEKHNKVVSKKQKETDVKELSDDDLKEKISRLKLEKEYSDLLKPAAKKKLFDGKAFVIRVLEKSGENIATQASAYVMGYEVNKFFEKMFKNGEKMFVDPKNIQKKK